MILVTGGSGSGKSAYAESLLTETEQEDGCGNFEGRYYIATMRVCDEEDCVRVAKHRQRREGKGFCTIEQPLDLSGALDLIRTNSDQTAGRACALLECMSNLTANEMFRGTGTETADTAADRIVRQVAALDDALDRLVVVTNNVFEDGAAYAPSTMEYLRALGEINRRLAARAERVIEVVAGIPVEEKKE